MMKDAQLALELKYSNRNVNHVFEQYRDSLTEKPMAYINQYLNNPFDVVKRPDLVDVYSELYTKLERTNEIVFTLITFVLKEKSVTLQALVGQMFNAYQCETFRRRTVLFEVILHAILECGYIKTERKDDFVFFKSKLPLSDKLNSELSLQGFVLPAINVSKIKSNRSIGYTTFNEHVISGGKLKEHDFEVCLDHLNRLNATEYTHEHRIGLMVQPKFDEERKFKDGHFETDKEFEKRRDSFEVLHKEIPAKVEIMMGLGNIFHLLHKYDNRLRTYVKSYHFNYQGTKFLKATVGFANKQLTTGDW